MKLQAPLNLPNILTIFRIFLVPFIVVVLLTEFSFERWFFMKRELLAVAIFVLASVTDILDGYIARKNKQVTNLGMLLDPVADKLLVVSVLISLVGMGWIPAWLAVIIVGREFGVTGIRLVAALRQVVIPAGQLGKWKMVLEVIAICFIIVGNQKEWTLMASIGSAIGLPDLQTIVLSWLLLTGEALLILVALIALISLGEYCVRLARSVDLLRGEAP